MELDRKTQDAFETMIDDSMVKRYDGDLECLGEGRHGETWYRPLDPDYVSNLLVDLWGEILHLKQSMKRSIDSWKSRATGRAVTAKKMKRNVRFRLTARPDQNSLTVP